MSVYSKELQDSKFLKLFSQNPSAAIAIATAIITIGSFVINFFRYTFLRGYLSVFSISIDNVGYSSSHGISGFLFDCINFIGLIVVLFIFHKYIIQYTVKKYKKRKREKFKDSATFSKKSDCTFLDVMEYLERIFVALLIGLTINFSLLSSIFPVKYMRDEEKYALLALIFLTTIELIISALIFFLFSNKKKRPIIKKDKREESLPKTKQEVESALSSKTIIRVDFYDLLAVFCIISTFYSFGAIFARLKTTFPIIENEYAVVYQNQQHYWTIAAQEKNDGVLLLNTQNQKILDVNGVEVIIKSFKEVEIS